MRYAVFFLAPFLLFIPACGPRYQVKSINTVQSIPFACLDAYNVRLSVAKINKKNANALFDNRGSRLLRRKKSTTLLLATITNNRTTAIVLKEKNVTVALMNPTTIARKLYAHTHRRVICSATVGLASAAITFLAAAYISIIGAVGSIPALIKTGYGLLGASGLMVVIAPVAGYFQAKEALRVNEAIDQDVRTKILNDELIIAPGHTEKIILAIDYKSYLSHFTITLIEQESLQELPFQIDMNQGELQCV
jgi:hypothetical protein